MRRTRSSLTVRTLTPALSLGRPLKVGRSLSAEGEGVRVSAAMVERLCAWFDVHARDLPWRRRNPRNGYRALVAEVMLQQTQVSRVVERFGEFMRAFPTARALAAADEQRVLALWQGMGYYRRARNLHAAAQMIVNEFGGRMPRGVDDLMRLPGVGRYTAGAIASIVYGERVPIVDGNVERVLARVFADRGGGSGGRNRRRGAGIAKPQAASVKAQAWAWGAAQMLVERASRPGVLNEAMMELGATVCVPSPAAPLCGECPVSRWCAARKLGVQAQVPVARRRAKPQAVHHHAVIVRRAGSELIMLEQRNGKGMWSGMWQTPTIERAAALDERSLARLLPVGMRAVRKRGEFVHHTTHRHIRFHVYEAMTSSRWRRRVGSVWRRADDVADLPMSNAQRRVLDFVRRSSCAG